MKLNNLTIAVLIALGTAACGGSNDATTPPHVDPTPTPTPQPDNDNNQAGRDDKGVVDPTDTHVVDNRDLSKESTVGGLQYIRRDGSQYDRANNPEQMASATPLLGVSLNEQNPKLTNIVLARRDLDYKDGEAVRAQFAGGTDVEPLTAAGKPREDDSLQVENFKNVDVLAGAFKQVGSAVFNDPNNRLDSITHNIDTHIQNNTDKNGEFTRERVTHVYTPRYEYRQPFVDYPNLPDPAGKEFKRDDLTPYAGVTATGSSPAGYADVRLPAPPGFNQANIGNDISRLESALKTSRTWVTENANDNSRHPVNIGTGTSNATGGFANDSRLYGNFPKDDGSGKYDDSPTNASSWAPANSWRNEGDTTRLVGTNNSPNHWGTNYIGQRSDDTGDGENDKTAREHSMVDWRYGTPGVEGAFADGASNARAIVRDGGSGRLINVPKPYNYQRPYPNGAYPRFEKDRFAYPNRPYDEADNNTLNGNDVADGVVRGHQHIYLEREEYSAIRQWKSIRPLINPVPHEWDWQLDQIWDVAYDIKVEEYTPTFDPITGSRNGKTLTRTRTVNDAFQRDEEHEGSDDFYPSITPRRSGSITERLKSDHTACNGDLIVCTVEKSSINLKSANWSTPKNTGGGQRGEFRGTPYIGWRQDDNVVRFADDRIWKPGTPGYRPENENKYGANLIWWSTQDSAFENWATSEGWNPRARRVDINTENCPGGDKCGEGKEDLVWGNNADIAQASGIDARDRDVEIQPTGDITNGLIRIGGYGDHGEGQPKTMPTLGEELKFDGARWKDHHKTSTRIFGHYHLAYADQDDRAVKAMSMNSYSGARSFVSQVERTLATPTAQGYYADLDSKPIQYSIGAKPITLQKVQYGRVTTNLDLTADGTNLLPNGFLRAPFEKKGTDESVDNYFFRGVDETTIDQMNALPSNQVARYEGHALMYGIDNSFHGIRTDHNQKNLPNAFDGTGGKNATAHTLGLGNFVEADVNFGTKKVVGDVYNAWLEQLDKPNVYKDKLVTFHGDVIGNTVIGTADRTYAPGDDEADFRAAFFGSQADEMGGSFNSVKATNKYGSAYEVGDWGGVFGAVKVGANANTFQGDDGGQNYGGGSAPAQTSNVADRYAP